MKKRKLMKVSLIIAGIGILTTGVYFGSTVLSKAAVLTEETTVMQEPGIDDEIIPSEGIESDETDNMYVELNNQLVEAIDNYNNGKITKEEYLDICESINKQIDTNKEYKELKNSEAEFKSGN